MKENMKDNSRLSAYLKGFSKHLEVEIGRDFQIVEEHDWIFRFNAAVVALFYFIVFHF